MGGHVSGGRALAWVACCLLLAALLAGCAMQDGSPATTGSAPSSTLTATRTATPAPKLAQTPTPPMAYTDLVPAPDISATAYLLIDPRTGTVYLAHNASSELPMASTTKIMTALVALTFGKPDQRITVGADAAALKGTGASVANLRQGDTLTLQELLYALLLPSGDDAAVAIAEGVSGSQERFVAEMNLEAALLGLWHTHYADVHGLDTPGHYTTARDLAVLARVAMRNSQFAQIVGTAKYTLAPTADHMGYTWPTTNELLTSQYYAGTTGVKTGFTGNAGDCLVFSASRSEGDLLGVELGEPSSDARFSDATALLDWGFAVEHMLVLSGTNGPR